MKRLIASLLATGCLLTLFGCPASEKGSGASEGKAFAELTTFGDIVDVLQKDKAYKAYKMTGSSYDVEENKERYNVTSEYELYDDGEYVYTALYEPPVSEQDNAEDYVVRYKAEDPKNTVEGIYKDGWVSCVMAPSVALDDDVSGLKDFPRDTAASDAAYVLDGTTYESKRVIVIQGTVAEKRISVGGNELAAEYSLDFFYDEGAPVVAIRIYRQGYLYTAVYHGIICADAPPETSRFAANLGAKCAENLTSIYMLSDSMEPALKYNGYYVFEKTESAALKEGDIVLVRDEIEETVFYYAHRIREIRASGTEFILRGDNNTSDDSTVFTAENILGKLLA